MSKKISTSYPQKAVKILISSIDEICLEINEFSNSLLKTRGGRMGSGMGTLLEALWGYYTNEVLNKKKDGSSCEIAWLGSHEYNDFACIIKDHHWDPESRTGELFRIEAKSMNIDADESKGHFDELYDNLQEWDLLLVLVWAWKKVDEFRVSPHITGYFIDTARSIAILRDKLHIARGGSFVDRNDCPDDCKPEICTHHGEPLNAAGKRERLSGPQSTRPSSKVSYAANFGGLVRMLKTNSEQARLTFRKLRAQNDGAHKYISFIHTNFPKEEINQYLTSEWRQLAKKLGMDFSGMGKQELVTNIRSKYSNYQEELREIDKEDTT